MYVKEKDCILLAKDPWSTPVLNERISFMDIFEFSIRCVDHECKRVRADSMQSFVYQNL